MNKANDWGGARKGAGRPKGSVKENTKNLQVAVRLTENEKKDLQHRADIFGCSISEYIHKRLF